MTEETATKGQAPTPGKFRAHGVQSEWLNTAKGQVIEVKLVNGEKVEGRLVGHDIYCIAVNNGLSTGSILIYKHSIVSIELTTG
jgi:RNA chaperone Hfq